MANAAEGVSFADGYPFLMIRYSLRPSCLNLIMCSEESLEDLNQRMKANPANAEKPELEMRRFRPNIVVKGAGTHHYSQYNFFKYPFFQTIHSDFIGKPFAEDDWKKFKIGDTVLYPVKMVSELTH